MTPQKTIDILAKIVQEDWHVYTDDAIEALNTAATTMLKEIPREVIRINSVYEGIEFGIVRCPKCKGLLVGPEKYCPKCGQKIDWEEKDEGV